MNSIEYAIPAAIDWHGLSARWILTLAHFLWEGVLIGLVAAAALALTRRASSHVRHGISVAALLCLIPCLAVTFVCIELSPGGAARLTADVDQIAEPNEPRVDEAHPVVADLPRLPIPPEIERVERADQVRPSTAVTADASLNTVPPSIVPVEPTFLVRYAPWIMAAYAAVVIALLLRTGIGVWGGKRLRAASERVQDAGLLAAVTRQAELIGLAAAPAVVWCRRVSVPTVVGIIKPIILLPATLSTGLDPDQLAAILSHELAHIRRHDLLINLLQRVVESLLFFHPVVWWISRRVSVERENCCDDVASATGFGNVEYAGSLLRMAELSAGVRGRRFAGQVAALSADGAHPSELSRRIERLLGMYSAPRLAASRLIAASAACVIVLGAATVGVLAQITEDDGGQADPANHTATKNEKPDDTDAAVKESAPRKGLEFLKPYPKLHGLSLAMTEKEFLAIARREKLALRNIPGDHEYSIETGDGYIVIVTFGDTGGKCSGIQRIGVGLRQNTREISENGEIVGQLIDAVTHQPVAGATVACGAIINDSGKGGGANAVTDERGHYRLVVPSPGIYNVWLKRFDRKPNMTAAADDGILVEAGRVSDSWLYFVAGRSVKGKLVENGQPVDDAGISAYSAARPHSGGSVQSVRTQADGSFEFFLPPGRAYVYANGRIKQNGEEAFARGLSANAYLSISATEDPEPITLALEKKKPLPFGSPEWINRSTPGTIVIAHEDHPRTRPFVTGTVVGEGGIPITGAKVFRYDGPIVVTDNAGEFQVKAARGTQFIMYAFAPGYHVWFGTPASGDVLKVVMERKQAPAVAVPEEVRSPSDVSPAPPKGLEFLKPYPKLHGLSLGMTEEQFLAIAKRMKILLQKTPGENSYSIPTGDGFTVIVMFGDGGQCSGIQRIRGNTMAVGADGIYWSPTASDGLRSGARLLAQDGRLKSGEPLVVQYYLRNESEMTKSLDVRTSKPVFPALSNGNLIDLSLFPSDARPQNVTIDAGQVLSRPEDRVEIATTGLPAGLYIVAATSYFTRPDADDANRQHGIPIRLSIPLTIEPADESEATPKRAPAPDRSESDDIAWGKPVAGLQAGARFSGKSREFAAGSEPQVQLLLRNATGSQLDAEILMPHPADGWLLNVENERGGNVLLERSFLGIYAPEQSFRLTLKPGEAVPITGVKQQINGGSSDVDNASLQIAREKPASGFWRGGILISEGGNYKAVFSVRMKRSDIPGLQLSANSGAASFRVLGPALKTLTDNPITLHGFNLAPFQSPRSFAELEKSEPIFDRERSIADGGAWRCWADSAQNYFQWVVYYAPPKNTFYVVDWKSEDKTVYGPIPGDAIEKLRLLDGSSDLVAKEADHQNLARAASLHVQRIERLMASSDLSLQTYGLKAFVKLGDFKMFELKNWAKRIETIADSTAGRGPLRHQVEIAQAYLAAQRERIEALKVKLDDSEYQPGRKATEEELALPWGRENGGLSLAVGDWAAKIRRVEVGDQLQITLLVRNTSDIPRRISTLNVLDGVGAIVTDEQSRLSARLAFTAFSGLPRTERYLLAPGQLVEIKEFSIQIKEGDLHPPEKTYNPKDLEIMYGYFNLQSGHSYRVDFTLSLPSASSGESTGRITLPAKGEFDGQLEAKPLRIALLSDKKDPGASKKQDPRKPGTSEASTKQWKARLIDGATGKPLAGIKVQAIEAVDGKDKPELMEFVSDGEGIFAVPVRDGKYATVSVLTPGWWEGGFQPVGNGRLSISKEDRKTAAPSPDRPVDIKLWPGQIVTGRLLYPDKSPAAGVLLNVGVYITDQEWKKRLGMDLNFYSFDHGEWPNWMLSVTTGDDGTFITTVPPKDVRWWVRVGTTRLGFTTIDPAQIDAGGTGRALATCVPLEVQIGGNKGIQPAAAKVPGALNFGDIPLESGVTVRGRVVDADGNGLEGIPLTTTGLHGPYSGRSARSGKEGEFRLQPIAPGGLTIHPDARLRDEKGQVISRDVRAVFIDRSYEIPDSDQPVELVVKAVPYVELAFEWRDRRAKEAPVSYYGEFTVRGFYQVDDSQRVYWHGETDLIERGGRKVLVAKVPKGLQDPELQLPRDQVVTASYEDETGRKSGPGQVELGDITRPIRRTIFGDEPAKQ